MKIIHCPVGEDPLTYARRAARRGGGGVAELVSSNGLIIGLVIAMIIGTFTIGPLRPKATEETPVAPPPVATASPSVAYVEPVMCDLPAGGRIEIGWDALVHDGNNVMRVRCTENGLEKITE